MNIKKISFFLIAALLIIILLLIVFNYQNKNSDKLEIIFLNVGQGDSILIKTPYHQQILIDGGPDNKVINELSKNLPFDDHDLDLVILTHPHSDHVVGLNEILKRYEVKKVLHTGVLHTTPDYLSFLEIIKNKPIMSEIIKAKQDFVLANDLKMEILFPYHDFSLRRPENLNNTSIVIRLVYKDFKVLLTGDMEESIEKELLRTGNDLRAKVMKAGHHGSKTASSEEFLDAVSPEAVVIQCGPDNDFGHPHLRTLKKFLRRGLAVYRNDLHGQVKIISDGHDYKVFTEK